MSGPDITALLHARDGQRERCPWCKRGLWDGALSTAEELIEHMVAAGRLVRVAGEGPARWEWVRTTSG